MKLKPFTLDGITYTAGHVDALRKDMIAMRDRALSHANFGYAVTLSQVIAVLGDYCEHLPDEAGVAKQTP